jgi:hypothetical protein
LGGLIAVVAAAPGIFFKAKPAIPAPAGVPVRPEQRAVARQEGSF